MKDKIIDWLHQTNFHTRTEWNGHLLWFSIDYEVQEHPYSDTIPAFIGWSISWRGILVVEYEPSLLQALRKGLQSVWRFNSSKEESPW